MRLTKLGTDDHGWAVPVHRLHRDAVCYCVGAGEDISFDVALIERIGCTVHTFDPTPRAIRHVQQLREQTRIGQPMPINGRSDQTYEVSASNLEQRLHFHAYGVYDEDAALRFYAPKHSDHVSHSIENLQSTEDYFVAECRKLGGILKELGHPQLDLLKLDVEGAEHRVLHSMMNEGIRPSILCVEFDAARQPR